MFIVAAVMIFAAGCGKERQSTISMDYVAPVTAQESQNHAQKEGMQEIDVEEIEAAMQTDDQIYVVLNVNTELKLIGLGAVDSPRTFQYGYTDGTQVLDKYGNYVSLVNLIPGRAVTIGELDEEAKLTRVQLTDQAWYQENITRFSIDETIGMIVIGDTKYSYDKELRVFSGDVQIAVGQIKEGDTICVQGVGQKIISVQVEHGQGTIALINTDLFEGGWISLGTKIYAKITPDMTMEVPEGTYMLSVANDGYGDTKEIEVERSKVTTVDLTEYKGNGPKLCKVTFEVYVDDARIYIDGKEIDVTKPTELRYGIHQMTVVADGYDNWERQLVIHSEETTIEIGDPDVESDSEISASNPTRVPDGTSNTTSGGAVTTTPAGDHEAGQTGGTTDTNRTDGTGNAGNTDHANNTTSPIDAVHNSSTSDYSDYLDTITDLIESLTGSN